MHIFIPSKRRYRVPRFNKVRLKHSFVHQAILTLNKNIQSEIKSILKVLDVCVVLTECIICDV